VAAFIAHDRSRVATPAEVTSTVTWADNLLLEVRTWSLLTHRLESKESKSSRKLVPSALAFSTLKRLV
jgi:hypothetical protein